MKWYLYDKSELTVRAQNKPLEQVDVADLRREQFAQYEVADLFGVRHGGNVKVLKDRHGGGAGVIVTVQKWSLVVQ